MLNHSARATIYTARANRSVSDLIVGLTESMTTTDATNDKRAVEAQIKALQSAQKFLSEVAGLVPQRQADVGAIAQELTTAYEQMCAEPLSTANDETDPHDSKGTKRTVPAFLPPHRRALWKCARCNILGRVNSERGASRC